MVKLSCESLELDLPKFQSHNLPAKLTGPSKLISRAEMPTHPND
jgi:hypothetical protein